MKRITITITILIIYTLFITAAYFIERSKRNGVMVKANETVNVIDERGAVIGSFASDHDAVLRFVRVSK